MPNVKCVGCGRQVSTVSIACPGCGTPVGYQGGSPVTPDRIVPDLEVRDETAVARPQGPESVARKQAMERQMAAGEDADEDGGAADIFWGGLFLVGGIIATIVTYATAAPGETYFVFWGAILFGGIQLVRGFFRGMS